MTKEIVTIKDEFIAHEDERGEMYEVVEDNGDRLLIELVKCSMPIKPRELVRRNMVETVTIKVGDIVESKSPSTRAHANDILTQGVECEVVKLYKDKDCGLSMVSVKDAKSSGKFFSHNNYPVELLVKKV